MFGGVVPGGVVGGVPGGVVGGVPGGVVGGLGAGGNCGLGLFRLFMFCINCNTEAFRASTLVLIALNAPKIWESA